MKNIVEIAVAANQFKTLVTAVKAAGLADTLQGSGPFTYPCEHADVMVL